MHLTVGICDDAAAELAHIKQLVSEWAEINSHSAQICVFPSAESFLFEYSHIGSMPDILLLDVEMGKMNGVALARHVRLQGYEGAIIFITGYPDFMAEGFDVSALHYLLKPVVREKLFEVLSRAASKKDTKTRSVVFTADGENVSMPVNDIFYAESRGHYMHVSTRKGQYRLRMTVLGAEEFFGTAFIRCGRAFVVNLEHVHKIGKNELTLTDGTEIPIPRGSQNELNLKLLKYTRER
ncbi:MAG: response regulator transcription factor [Clostridia bacterium]|nr:response regulator transcription factor [Clostridia bacterium]